MKIIRFQDEIVLYWDKEWELQSSPRYRVYVNGKEVATTEKTHFTLYQLTPRTTYEIEIVRMVDDVQTVLFSEKVTTETARKYIDVTKPPYNAVGDGKTVNTAALQRAIDDCKAGETVYIPVGVYLSGALKMHSDMELYVAKDAILQGTSKAEDYLPKIKSRFEGWTRECYRSLLNMGELDENNYDYSCENVVIRGGGAIYGGGLELLNDTIAVEKENLKDFISANPDVLKAFKNENVYYARARGRLINASNTKNVVISDLSLGYGASWNLHFIYSKEVVTCNCSISSEGVWNGDGWDPDSSEDCTLFNVDFCTGDDCVAIKSGKNPEGNIINRPSRNIRVFDCRCKNGHSIAVGSEMSGGVSDVFVWDCDIQNCEVGFQIKSARKRGGYVKNVRVADCKSSVIAVWVSLSYNDDGVSAEELPVLSDYTFENITLTGWEYPTLKRYIELCGAEEEQYHIRNVSFKNIRCLNVGEHQVLRVKNADNIRYE